MSTIRFCSHCRRDLTDAVSLELGVGPVCRGIANEVMAHAIPAELDAARTIAAELLVMVAAAAVETASKLTEMLTQVAFVELGTDLRVPVKQIDWALSYQQPTALRTGLLKLMKALGYVGLANIIEGKACTSEAELSAGSGRIVVKGAKNAHAAHTFKRIQGWSFSSVTKTWSFPVTSAAQVEAAIAAHYPATKTPLAPVVAAAQEQLAAMPQTFKSGSSTAPFAAAVAVPTLAPAAPKVVAVIETLNEGFITVKTPYNPAFIGALKAAISNWKDRTWNAPVAPQRWLIAAQHAPVVQKLVAEHFPVAA
jgi:hypothetical protein